MSGFEDRKKAGELLAKRLLKLNYKRPVILALPCGGLPVAVEVARELGAPLDILAVKKIGAPHNPEFAIGAVSEDGKPLLDEELIHQLGFDKYAVEQFAKKKAREAVEQAKMFRAEFPMQPVGGRHVIIVDDGLATGATMEAAVRVLRQRHASHITVAVPVTSESAEEKLRILADEFVCLLTPTHFSSVGVWYRSFEQVSNEEALNYLRQGQPDKPAAVVETDVLIPISHGKLHGILSMPAKPKGVVLFAHGSGSSRLSPRNRAVAAALSCNGFATLLFDLLTAHEAENRKNVFDIKRLAHRLLIATKWVRTHHPSLPIAYFGASTGAAAAIEAAAAGPQNLFAIVSRGGRVDMAEHLDKVETPTLLIVGGNDDAVLPLNHWASEKLENSRIAVIAGAGHLFEEPGSLEEVIEHSIDWLIENLRPQGYETKKPKEAMTREIERLAQPLESERDFREFAKQISNAKIVMFGEATHGTQEFYEIRRKLSQYLLAEHGFDFIAVEGDWPDCHALNQYIETGGGENAKAIMLGFRRWPQWMWANTEIIHLIEWMRRQRKAGFYGLDVYSLFESIDVIHRYSEKKGIDLPDRILNHYACFEPFARDEIAYARSLLEFPAGCRDEVLTSLRELLNVRLRMVKISAGELFDLQQNARVIANAETYYRAMLNGDTECWNVRDRHMLETLQALLKRSGPESKAIVWAHNTHIGDYHATDMAAAGYVNIGGLAREFFAPEQICLVGFGTYQGTVLAGHAWGAPEEIMQLPAAKAGISYEHYFHQACVRARANQMAYVFDQKARTGPLSRKLGQRAAGVVYHPDYEFSGRNYVPTILTSRYDAFVFADQTTALTSLHQKAEHGLFPETWPLGQ